jgi:ribosomal protein S18 acetylase RimI-like enzyme
LDNLRAYGDTDRPRSASGRLAGADYSAVVISFRPATPDETQRWLAEWRPRLTDWNGRHGAVILTRRVDGWEADPGELHAMLEPGSDRVAGFLAIAAREGMSLVTDIWVEPELRGRGYGRAARRFAEEWAAQHEPRLGIVICTDDPAAAALAADLPLRVQKMVKRLEAPALPTGVSVRPMIDAEFDAWLASDIEGYATDVADSGLLTYDEARAMSVKAYGEMVPQRLATPGYTWWCLDSDRDRAVASIWIKHTFAPTMSYVYSVETRPEHRGRGYGRAAMLAGEWATAQVGHQHLGLNVFGHNAIAIRLYDRLGYVTVEQLRST